MISSIPPRPFVPNSTETVVASASSEFQTNSETEIWSGRRDGAGEGIRTLDPNLGKVVLYP
jgi:hypothetical protein